MRAACLILFLILFDYSSSQEGNIEQLLLQAENAIYSEPQEAIRIAQYVSQNTEKKFELQQAGYILARSYYLEEKYNEALKIGMKFSQENNRNPNDSQLQLNVLLAKILTELELKKLAQEYMHNADVNSQKFSSENNQDWIQGKALQYNLSSKKGETPNQALKRLYKAKNKFQKITSNLPESQIGNVHLEIAAIYLRTFQLDSASHYLEKAYAESKAMKPGNYLEMKSLVAYGEYFFLRNSHIIAIDTLESALRTAEKFTNLSEQIRISQAMAENYLALNELEKFNFYNQQANELSITQDDAENDAVNTAFNFVTDNETRKIEALRNTSRSNLLLLVGIFLTLLITWVFMKLRYRFKINQYRKFLGFMKKRKETVVAQIPTKQDAERTLNIPKEAEELLLTKLITFEESLNFTSKEISLSRLALQFETNTKYLSEVINIHKQKNFNSYINELRINYIIDKLKNDPKYLQYKISYLAEDSGFASHSVFATVFKMVTGISPTTFIGILQDKSENSAA